MTNSTNSVAQLNHEGFYLYPTFAYGDGMPGGAREEFPPGMPLPEHHRWRWDGAQYVATPDYRGQLVYRPDGTTYYPDTWGPLPDGDSLDAPPPPPPTLDELAAAVRSERDRRLAATDYLMMPDYPIEAGQRAGWEAYRQALRDLPAQEGFPWGGPGDEAVPWPVEPGA